ncbi:BEACH domain-containing protein lvsC [Diplonema papillatum]|nr:BEACH domain-containing protein lvsC [Diplonema papillatum]
MDPHSERLLALLLWVDNGEPSRDMVQFVCEQMLHPSTVPKGALRVSEIRRRDMCSILLHVLPRCSGDLHQYIVAFFRRLVESSLASAAVLGTSPLWGLLQAPQHVLSRELVGLFSEVATVSFGDHQVQQLMAPLLYSPNCHVVLDYLLLAKKFLSRHEVDAVPPVQHFFATTGSPRSGFTVASTRPWPDRGFTFSASIYPHHLSGAPRLVSFGTGKKAVFEVHLTSRSVTVASSKDGTVHTADIPVALPCGSWSHVAVTFQYRKLLRSQVLVFVNGGEAGHAAIKYPEAPPLDDGAALHLFAAADGKHPFCGYFGAVTVLRDACPQEHLPELMSVDPSSTVAPPEGEARGSAGAAGGKKAREWLGRAAWCRYDPLAVSGALVADTPLYSEARVWVDATRTADISRHELHSPAQGVHRAGGALLFLFLLKRFASLDLPDASAPEHSPSSAKAGARAAPQQADGPAVARAAITTAFHVLASLVSSSPDDQREMTENNGFGLASLVLRSFPGNLLPLNLVTTSARLLQKFSPPDTAAATHPPPAESTTGKDAKSPAAAYTGHPVQQAVLRHILVGPEALQLWRKAPFESQMHALEAALECVTRHCGAGKPAAEAAAFSRWFEGAVISVEALLEVLRRDYRTTATGDDEPGIAQGKPTPRRSHAAAAATALTPKEVSSLRKHLLRIAWLLVSSSGGPPAGDGGVTVAGSFSSVSEAAAGLSASVLRAQNTPAAALYFHLVALTDALAKSLRCGGTQHTHDVLSLILLCFGLRHCKQALANLSFALVSMVYPLWKHPHPGIATLAVKITVAELSAFGGPAAKRHAAAAAATQSGRGGHTFSFYYATKPLLVLAKRLPSVSTRVYTAFKEAAMGRATATTHTPTDVEWGRAVHIDMVEALLALHGNTSTRYSALRRVISADLTTGLAGDPAAASDLARTVPTALLIRYLLASYPSAPPPTPPVVVVEESAVGVLVALCGALADDSAGAGFVEKVHACLAARDDVYGAVSLGPVDDGPAAAAASAGVAAALAVLSLAAQDFASAAPFFEAPAVPKFDPGTFMLRVLSLLYGKLFPAEGGADRHSTRHTANTFSTMVFLTERVLTDGVVDEGLAMDCLTNAIKAFDTAHQMHILLGDQPHRTVIPPALAPGSMQIPVEKPARAELVYEVLLRLATKMVSKLCSTDALAPNAIEQKGIQLDLISKALGKNATTAADSELARYLADKRSELHGKFDLQVTKAWELLDTVMVLLGIITKQVADGTNAVAHVLHAVADARVPSDEDDEAPGRPSIDKVIGLLKHHVFTQHPAAVSKLQFLSSTDAGMKGQWPDSFRKLLSKLSRQFVRGCKEDLRAWWSKSKQPTVAEMLEEATRHERTEANASANFYREVTAMRPAGEADGASDSEDGAGDVSFALYEDWGRVERKVKDGLVGLWWESDMSAKGIPPLRVVVGEEEDPDSSPGAAAAVRERIYWKVDRSNRNRLKRWKPAGSHASVGQYRRDRSSEAPPSAPAAAAPRTAEEPETAGILRASINSEPLESIGLALSGHKAAAADRGAPADDENVDDEAEAGFSPTDSDAENGTFPGKKKGGGEPPAQQSSGKGAGEGRSIANSDGGHGEHNGKNEAIPPLKATDGEQDSAPAGTCRVSTPHSLQIAGANERISREAHEGVLTKTACHLITPLELVAGTLSVTPRRLLFVLSPEADTPPPKPQAFDFRPRTKNVTVPLENIATVRPLRYYLQPNSLEITVEGVRAARKAYTFKFRDETQRKNFARAVNSAAGKSAGFSLFSLVAGGPQKNLLSNLHLRSPADAVKKLRITEQWVKGRLSNYDYLLELNFLAGRTFSDVSQYPVLPWVLSDYTSQTIDLGNQAVYRDLSKPIGALNPQRLKGFRDRYAMMGADSGVPPFLYGSHYSYGGAVLHYLIRMEPFASMLLKLQDGKWDVPDRMFSSIAGAWEGCMQGPTDVKELVPEFFSTPEFLVNHNKFAFGKLADGTALNDVVLPPWAHDACHFVYIQRKALESQHVSANLHKWIDLVFGSKQRGAAAIEADNVFYYLTYEGAVRWETVEASERESLQGQIQSFGQTPSQLFAKPHPQKDPRPRTDAKWTESDMLEALGGYACPPAQHSPGAPSRQDSIGPRRRTASFKTGADRSSAGGAGSAALLRTLLAVNLQPVSAVFSGFHPILGVAVTAAHDAATLPTPYTSDFSHPHAPPVSYLVSVFGPQSSAALKLDVASLKLTHLKDHLLTIPPPHPVALQAPWQVGPVDAALGDSAFDTSASVFSTQHRVCEFGAQHVLAVGFWDGGMRVCKRIKGVVQTVVPGDLMGSGPGAFTCVAASGIYVAVGTSRGLVLVLSAAYSGGQAAVSDQVVHVVRGHASAVTCVAVDAGMDTITSCSGSTVFIHTLRRAQFVRILQVPWPSVSFLF